VPAPLTSNEGPPNLGSSERAKREAMNDRGTRMAALQQFPIMADAIWARPCSIGSSSNSGSTWRLSSAYGSPARSGSLVPSQIPQNVMVHASLVLSVVMLSATPPGRPTDCLRRVCLTVPIVSGCRRPGGIARSSTRRRGYAREQRWCRWDRVSFEAHGLLWRTGTLRCPWAAPGGGRDRYSYRSASMGSISAAFIAG
jgi:hypothetical protein